ncbi:[4Fe-4S] proteins maturation, partial [Mycoemilia scoparia]
HYDSGRSNNDKVTKNHDNDNEAAQTQQNQQSSEDSITNTSNTGNNKTSEESSSGEEGGADDASGLILTKEAIERLKYLTKKEGKTQYLRVRVDSGGCYGFQYMMDLVDSIESDDVVFDREGAKFVIDEVSLPLIRGATIHWADELIGQSFRIVANPQSSGGCGCGASFELKF